MGKPIGNANVVLYDNRNDDIITYCFSNTAGDFIVFLGNHKSDSLRLEISCIGFVKLIRIISAKSNQNFNLTLQISSSNLSEIVIKQEPIQVIGDTINYDTKSFSDKSDRVILDVIKKIPGIKVTASGQILFNNKAINKFYIEGKDLLEDRYSIASNNLPANVVDEIQVLQNHQPISLLNGFEHSDRAAINIKLNKNAKLRLIGSGYLGLGISPFLRDNNLTVLKFKKNIQFINSIKNNNVGINLDKELTDLVPSGNLSTNASVKQDLVSLVRANTPPLDQARFWFNNNTIANSNYLIG